MCKVGVDEQACPQYALSRLIELLMRDGFKLCAQAVKRLRETLEWRSSERVDQIRCLACTKDPCSHYMHPVGYDKLGRPVLYSCLQLAANRSVEDNRLHMVATFEQVLPVQIPNCTSCFLPLLASADAKPYGRDAPSSKIIWHLISSGLDDSLERVRVTALC